MFQIQEHVKETPLIRTIRFSDGMDAIPGQFVMVWVPGVDEFPMSVSFAGKRLGITYQIIGEGTRALAALKTGASLGIRGPYGNGFSMKGNRILAVGGGAGMAPIAPLLDELSKGDVDVDLVLGARTSDEILFEKRAQKTGAAVHITTDDGTKGIKGLATELAATLLERKKFDRICACGPEKMAFKLMDIAANHRTPMEASLERIMKCGIGICDSCALDGKHVCRDGPVFSMDELRKFEEFGRTKLDRSGRKVPV